MPIKQLISELDCFKYPNLIYLLSIYYILVIKILKINKACTFVLGAQSQVREKHFNNDFH